MYGDQALQLVTSAHSASLSTGPIPLPKYALPLILSICLETRQLATAIAASTDADEANLTQNRPLLCALTVQHLAARRNKRCLLAYLRFRLGIIEERWWDAGGALAHLLAPSVAAAPALPPAAGTGSAAAGRGVAGGGEAQAVDVTPDLRSAMSAQELEFVRGYNSLHLDYKSDFLDVLDLAAPIDRPPGELMVNVRVVRDAGDVFLEGGERVELRKGERFRLERSQIQRLIVQGYLEEV